MVLEVGPGLGSLTFPLSLKTDNLGCVEIDKGLADHLKETITNATIFHQDFLKFERPENVKIDVVVSNIPYYIMTDIMKKLFSEYTDARKMVFMVEDEAIARIDCKPGSKQYGPLAILASLYGGYKYEFKVPSTAFIPQPRTTSAVISFTRSKTEELVVNTDSPLITKLEALESMGTKKEEADRLAQHIYDQAKLAHGSLDSAGLERFLKYNTELLSKSADNL